MYLPEKGFLQELRSSFLDDPSNIVNSLYLILLGVVSALIVLALQVFAVPASREFSYRLKGVTTYAHIWGFSDHKKVYIVSGSLNTTMDPSMPKLMEPDTDAIYEVMSTLRGLRHGLELERMYSSSFPAEYLNKDLIAIGGPKYNQVTNKLMSLAPKLVIFKEEIVDATKNLKFFFIHDEISHKDYKPSYEDDGTLTKDYGLILALHNPLSLSHRCIIFAGCDSHGVLASVDSISLHNETNETIKEINKRIGGLSHREKYFMCIISCQIVGHAATNLKVEELHPLNDKNEPVS